MCIGGVIRVNRLEHGIGDCPVCGGSMRCCGPERMEEMILGWVKSRDPKDRARMQKNAELLNNCMVLKQFSV